MREIVSELPPDFNLGKSPAPPCVPSRRRAIFVKYSPISVKIFSGPRSIIMAAHGQP